MSLEQQYVVLFIVCVIIIVDMLLFVLLFCRRLSDIFKKGKRHFRKTLRGRNEDQEVSSSASNSSSTPSLPIPSPSSQAQPVPEKNPYLSSLLPYPALLPASSGGGDGGDSSSLGVGGGGAAAASGEEGNLKDRIQQWIQQQASGFLDKWAGPSSINPALDIVARLKETGQGLDPKSTKCLGALNVRHTHAICSFSLYFSSSLSPPPLPLSSSPSPPPSLPPSLFLFSSPSPLPLPRLPPSSVVGSV